MSLERCGTCGAAVPGPEPVCCCRCRIALCEGCLHDGEGCLGCGSWACAGCAGLVFVVECERCRALHRAGCAAYADGACAL